MTARTIPAADKRVLAAVAAAREAGAEYRVAKREALRLYHEAACHPDMPEICRRKDDRKKMKEIWRTVGYDSAASDRERAYRVLKRAVTRVSQLRPATLRGVIAAAELLTSADSELLQNLFLETSPLKIV